MVSLSNIDTVLQTINLKKLGKFFRIQVHVCTSFLMSPLYTICIDPGANSCRYNDLVTLEHTRPHLTLNRERHSVVEAATIENKSAKRRSSDGHILHKN